MLTDPSYPAQRDAWQRVATHVLARAQYRATGRFGLRSALGGFSTIEFGEDRTRLRVAGGMLLRETAGPPSRSTAIDVAPSSLRELAAFADVDLDDEFSAGHDTPELGDIDAACGAGAPAANLIGALYATASSAIDQLAFARSDHDAVMAPSVAQLWPEHFDLATDIAYDSANPDTARVNLGASPGDAAHPEPYLYVGPWSEERPGDSAYWNAPFGATLAFTQILTGGDPSVAAFEFFTEGLGRLLR